MFLGPLLAHSPRTTSNSACQLWQRRADRQSCILDEHNAEAPQTKYNITFGTDIYLINDAMQI